MNDEISLVDLAIGCIGALGFMWALLRLVREEHHGVTTACVPPTESSAPVEPR